MSYRLPTRSNPAPPTRRRLARLPEISTYEARQRAELMVRRGAYSPGQQRAIQLLATFGVVRHDLLLEHTGVAERTLRDYRARGHIDVVELPPALGGLLGPEHYRAAILGPVGQVLAEMEQGMAPRGYLNATHDRLSHDLLCSLVALRIGHELQRAGWEEVRFRGRYEATVHDEQGRPLLEPDALIEGTTPGGARKLFLLEYHHESFGSRAAEKIARYEALWAAGSAARWQEAWETNERPTLLAVWTHRAVGTGYQAEIGRWEAGRGLQGRYLGRPLRSFLDDAPAPWRDFRQQAECGLVGD